MPTSDRDADRVPTRRTAEGKRCSLTFDGRVLTIHRAGPLGGLLGGEQRHDIPVREIVDAKTRNPSAFTSGHVVLKLRDDRQYIVEFTEQQRHRITRLVHAVLAAP